MHTARLEQWALVFGSRLHGLVYGHPNFTDGTRITTSSIQHVDKDNEEVHTHNTIYVLGTTDPNYEATFPNARERFFNGSLAAS